MKKHLSKRRVVVSALIAVLLAIASGVAYAYWTGGGTGTGPAAAAAGTSAVTPIQTTALAAMYPGDIAQVISGKFNNTSTGPVWVTTVTASIGTVTQAAGAPVGTCNSTDFTLTDTVVTVNAEVPAGNNMGAWTGPTIKFNDKGAVNQYPWKGATLVLSYTAA